jgi:hypothetical protein
VFQREPIRASHLRSEHSQGGAQRSEQYLYGAQRAVQSTCGRSGSFILKDTTVLGQTSSHVYEVRPRADKRGFDLISEALPFGRLWYCKPDDAVGYAKFYSRSHNMIVRVFDESGALIETHESEGGFREP